MTIPTQITPPTPGTIRGFPGAALAAAPAARKPDPPTASSTGTPRIRPLVPVVDAGAPNGAQHGGSGSAERRLDEVEAVAQIGSYSLDVASGRWSSSIELDAILGIDDTFDRTIAGWASLVHPADRDALLAYLEQEVLGLGHPFDRHYRIVRPDTGEERWVHGRGTLELDAGGRPRASRWPGRGARSGSRSGPGTRRTGASPGDAPPRSSLAWTAEGGGPPPRRSTHGRRARPGGASRGGSARAIAAAYAHRPGRDPGWDGPWCLATGRAAKRPS